MAVDGIHIDPVYNGMREAVREEEGGQGGDGGGQREEGGGPASEDIVFRRRLVYVMPCTYLISLLLFSLVTLLS